jgi:hypothetical protein
MRRYSRIAKLAIGNSATPRTDPRFGYTPDKPINILISWIDLVAHLAELRIVFRSPYA